MIKSRDEVLRNIRRGIAADTERSWDWYPCRHFPKGECHHPECKPETAIEPRSAPQQVNLADYHQLKAQVKK